MTGLKYKQINAKIMFQCEQILFSTMDMYVFEQPEVHSQKELFQKTE